MTSSDLQLIIKQPEEFFREKVTAAASSLKVSLSQNVEHYVVSLLVDFINPERLKSNLGDVDVMDTPLAIMLKKAIESPPTMKLKLFKTMGDTSLYLSGFFQDYFNRKTFDVDYYITLGASAYTHVSSMMRDRHGDDHFTAIYDELAENFPALVDIVAEVSETPSSQSSSRDILTIYHRWAKCNSERLRRLLEEHGITPVASPLKIAQ